jgi:hypothetical protein
LISLKFAFYSLKTLKLFESHFCSLKYAVYSLDYTFAFAERYDAVFSLEYAVCWNRVVFALKCVFSLGNPSFRFKVHYVPLGNDAASSQYVLHERVDIDPGRIVLFGRSLGGAVAVYAADQYAPGVRAVVLENTFTSISDMVNRFCFRP